MVNDNEPMRYQQKASAFNLKPDDIQKLCYNVKTTRDKLIILTLWWLGLRNQELRELDVRDIDFDLKRVHVHGKGDKLRVVPIIDDGYLIDLKLFIGDRKRGFVFQKSNGRGLSDSGLRYVLRETAKRAGVENPNPSKNEVHPHLFRHSIARWLKNQGMAAEWVKDFLGHETIDMTMSVYGTLSVDEMQKQAFEKFGGTIGLSSNNSNGELKNATPVLEYRDILKPTHSNTN